MTRQNTQRDGERRRAVRVLRRAHEEKSRKRRVEHCDLYFREGRLTSTSNAHWAIRVFIASKMSHITPRSAFNASTIKTGNADGTAVTSTTCKTQYILHNTHNCQESYSPVVYFSRRRLIQPLEEEGEQMQSFRQHGCCQ